MTKKITGSWFEFQHFSEVEADEWNATLRGFSAEQWRAKLREFKEFGVDTLVLMNTGLLEQAFHRSDHFPPLPMGCVDPLEVVLTEADAIGIQFFVGVGFYSSVYHGFDVVNSKEATRQRMQMIEEVAARYGQHESFVGWYWPREAEINGVFPEAYLQYVGACSTEARRLLPKKKIMIAPYGTRTVTLNAPFLKQLETIDVDVLAYQDEVGVEKTEVEELPKIWKNVRAAHEAVGRTLPWADVEVFRFRGEVYKSALLPASFERVERQLKAASPHVEKILIYQCMGLINAPGSPAMAGHPDSVQLHGDYTAWAKRS